MSNTNNNTANNDNNTNNGNAWFDADFDIPADVMRAVKAYAKSKPWRGTVAQQRDKLHHAHVMLCDAFKLGGKIQLCTDGLDDTSPTSFWRGDTPPPAVQIGTRMFSFSRNVSGVNFNADETNAMIVLAGRLSVVTYLRLLGYVVALIGDNPGDTLADEFATRFAVNAFARAFPRSFACCTVTEDGTVLRADA